MNKNSEFGAAILIALFVGIFLVQASHFFATVYKFERDLKVTLEPMARMRAECEAELPRSQKYVVKFVPQDK